MEDKRRLAEFIEERVFNKTRERQEMGNQDELRKEDYLDILVEFEESEKSKSPLSRVAERV